MNTIQYIVINNDLEMTPGKAAAQVAHAVSLVSKPKDIKAYNKAKQRTVIVLAGTADQIKNLGLYLYERGIKAEYVVDEGVNEIPTMTVTALATEQFDIADEDTRQMFEGFELYRGHAEVRRTDHWGFPKETIKTPARIETESRYAFRQIKKGS